MIYNKKIKKILPKKPKGPLQQFLKEKKGQKPASGESFLQYWKTVFDGLSEAQKKKYVEKAEKARKEAEAEKEEAQAEAEKPVLLATIGGTEIMSDNADLQYWMSYYLYQLANSG